MFRGRSYTVFCTMPRQPIVEWLADLDASLEQSKGFFAGHPIVVDLSAVTLSVNAITQLLASLEERNIRILGIEGLDPAAAAPGLPPILRGGRNTQSVELLPDVEPVVAAPAAPKPQQPSLLVEDPVRSGQTVVFIGGDITVLGSARAPRSSPVDRSTSTARCAAAPWRALPAMRAPASSVIASRPSCWRS